MGPEMSFVEVASAEILKTLLSVFFLRQTINGRQFSHEAMVHSAHRFALALEAEKTDDDSINHTAIQVAAGLLFAFYQNRPANKNWTAMVHRGKTRRFVRDAYAIAQMLAQEINQVPADAERSAALDRRRTKPALGAKLSTRRFERGDRPTWPDQRGC
jgi:hypothetical protein